jgi:hypothetical protein
MASFYRKELLLLTLSVTTDQKSASIVSRSIKGMERAPAGKQRIKSERHGDETIPYHQNFL